MKRFLFPILVAAAVSAQETSVKFYPVRYADAAESAEVIEAMVPSTNGFSIRTVDRKLAVRGTDEQHAVVEEILRDLDQAPRNVQINVEFSRSGSFSADEAGIRPNGPVIFRDGEVHGSFEGRFGSSRSSVQENTVQMLVAMDGKSASLRVGETVPYLTWLTEYGWRHGYIREAHIEWREVGSFLAVRPEIIGNGPMVRIRLVPTLSGRRTDGQRETVEFTDLATEVVARAGQPISIGGFSADQEFSSKFLVGRSGGRESSVTGITLTPRILE